MGCKVAVVGAGITGLVAGWEMLQAGVDVVLLEAGNQAGGKISGSTVGGIKADAGPDGFITRDPAAIELCDSLGLASELVTPEASKAYIWCEEALRCLPEKSLLGVPYNAAAAGLTDILTPAGLAALRHGLSQQVTCGGSDDTFSNYATITEQGSTQTDTSSNTTNSNSRDISNRDISIGTALRPRIGDEAFERLVDPLLGGIHAGTADDLSLAACAPVICEALQQNGTLAEALGRRRELAADKKKTAVFKSVRGGVFRIVDALTAKLGKRVQLGTPVLSLEPEHSGRSEHSRYAKHAVNKKPVQGSQGQHFRGGGQYGMDAVNEKSTQSSQGWRLTTPQRTFSTDAVILATPAWVTGRLLEPYSATAANLLKNINYADVVLVTFVLPLKCIARPLDGAGFLVPRSEGLMTTACSWTSSKWQHYQQSGKVVLRVSAGRIDDRRWVDLNHFELAAVLIDELAYFGVIDPSVRLTGNIKLASDVNRASTAKPDLAFSTCDTVLCGSTTFNFPAAGTDAAVRVTPWFRALPQYRPGHLELVKDIEEHLNADTSGLVAAGAAFNGLGLSACVRQGRNAAVAVLEKF